MKDTGVYPGKQVGHLDNYLRGRAGGALRFRSNKPAVGDGCLLRRGDRGPGDHVAAREHDRVRARNAAESVNGWGDDENA